MEETDDRDRQNNRYQKRLENQIKGIQDEDETESEKESGITAFSLHGRLINDPIYREPILAAGYSFEVLIVGTKIGKEAVFAERFLRLTDLPAMQDHAMSEVDPLILWDLTHNVLFNLTRILCVG